MSAYLDKSQGITFSFSNFHEAFLKAKHAKLDSPFVVEKSEPVGRVIKAADAKVEKFTAPEIKPAGTERPFEVPMGVREAEEKAKRLNMLPIAALQKNLNDLTDAQEKLRFLLQEIEALTKKKG